MRQSFIYASAAAISLTAVGCTSINGLSDFKVDPSLGEVRPGGECTTNQQCIDALGANNVCRKADGTCVPLISENCGRVYGDYANDAAVIFGTMGDLSGANASTGTSMTNAVELAADDINNYGGLPSLPGATQYRPVVLVECDDKNKNDVAVAVATHLAETVRVPAVIGSNSSSVSIEIFNNVFRKNKTLEMSPAATATSFSTFPDDGLFWRTIPSLQLNVDALVKALPDLERHVRAKAAVAAGAPITVGVIMKNDGFGKSSYDATVNNPEFAFNGKAGPSNGLNFKLIQYENPNDTTMEIDYSSAVAEAIALKPHVLFMYGANEVIDKVLPQIEAQWPDGTAYRPFYLFHSNGFKINLWNQIAKLDPTGVGLRARVLGTNPGVVGIDSDQFRVKFEAKFNDATNSSPDSLGTMNAYDAMYVLAMAAAAAGANVTGPDMSLAMAKLGTGQEIKVGGDGTQTAFNLLSVGQTVNLRGITGPLDFDAAGDVVSNVYFYCVRLVNNAPEKVGTYSGTKFDPLTRLLASSTGTGSYFDELKQYCGL